MNDESEDSILQKNRNNLEGPNESVYSPQQKRQN